ARAAQADVDLLGRFDHAGALFDRAGSEVTDFQQLYLGVSAVELPGSRAVLADDKLVAHDHVAAVGDHATGSGAQTEDRAVTCVIAGILLKRAGTEVADVGVAGDVQVATVESVSAARVHAVA